MKLSRLKRLVFALVAITGSFVFMLLLLFGMDLYAHSRVERSAGLNRHGYRGPVIGKKRPGETRIVMLGGSTVFGFDVEVEETVPALLERELVKTNPNVRVVNLGYHQEAAIAFVPTLRSYEYLDYDVVLLYEGYNDIFGDAGPNTAQRRHASPVFRAFGYFPILPLVLREKASFLRGPAGGQATFKPGVAKSTSAAALDATSAIAEALNRQLDRMVDPVEVGPHTGPGCAAPWSHYCGSVAAAIRYARERQREVLVIGQPRLKYEGSMERHASQQRALKEMIARDFAGDPHVRYVDFGDVVNTDDLSIAFDGMHLNAKGNGMIAAKLAPIVREIISR